MSKVVVFKYTFQDPASRPSVNVKEEDLTRGQ